MFCFKPHIDLFTSSLNDQIFKYVSRSLSQNSLAIHAFSIWTIIKFYPFRPVSLIIEIISKIKKGNSFWDHHYSVLSDSVLVLSDDCTFKTLSITIANQYFDLVIQQQLYPSSLPQTETSCTVPVSRKSSHR